jgi:hypothetical protein
MFYNAVNLRRFLGVILHFCTIIVAIAVISIPGFLGLFSQWNILCVVIPFGIMFAVLFLVIGYYLLDNLIP